MERACFECGLVAVVDWPVFPGSTSTVPLCLGCAGRAGLDVPACVECGALSEHQHHVIPQVHGGTGTVPLCSECHARAHEVESLATSALVKEGQAKARAAGVHVGGLRFGLQYSNRLDGDGHRIIEEHPEEMAALTDLEAGYRESGTYKGAAQYANELGHVNRAGRPWKETAVRRLLQSDKG